MTSRLCALFLLLFSEMAMAQEKESDHFAPASDDPFAFGFEGSLKEKIDGPVEEQIKRKLKTIILPNIQLDSVPLDIADDFLMSRSVELDHSTPDPKKKGVNIILRPGVNGTNIPEATISAGNITLEEAISQIAKAGGKVWWVANGAVVIGDKSQKQKPYIAENLSPEISATLGEWKSIVLPTVGFANTPLNEVLDLIQKRSAELDGDPPFHSIELKVSISAKKLTSDDLRIELGLRNASAFDVLVQALAQGGYDLRVLENGFRIRDLSTDIHVLDWDHWLWMMRIAKRDPEFTPPNFNPDNQTIRMFERKSAKQIYEDCGINLGDGDSFIYSVVTSQMITRLGRVNQERVALIHKTIAAWKAGRTDEWHLDWMP